MKKWIIRDSKSIVYTDKSKIESIYKAERIIKQLQSKISPELREKLNYIINAKWDNGIMIIRRWIRK